jgi:RNA polymerase primary sigma factor
MSIQAIHRVRSTPLPALYVPATDERGQVAKMPSSPRHLRQRIKGSSTTTAQVADPFPIAIPIHDGDRAPRQPRKNVGYIYHLSFDDPAAAAKYLEPMSTNDGDASEPFARPSRQLLGHYGATPPLKPSEEAHLFLKMNYLKYRAQELRNAVEADSQSDAERAEIERLELLAQSVKHQIVRSNLRLVLSIAKGRAGPDRGLLDLVSDGHLALILAAEKFDVSRGFKFSTYAHCAIVREFGRTIGKESRWRRRFVTGHLETAQEPFGHSDEDGGDAAWDQDQAAVSEMLSPLTDRERTVIVGRFGLDGGREKTLRVLGEELGVTRERVRQIESEARAKLRQIASQANCEASSACAR